MIKPAAGRVVLFTPAANDAIRRNGDQKLAAIIASVWSDTCVNLAVFDANGIPTSRTSVFLVQDAAPAPESCYCEWMDYQKGQARKTEELEAIIEASTNADPAVASEASAAVEVAPEAAAAASQKTT